MTTPAFRMALAHYDRHVPLFEGRVPLEGGTLQTVPVGQSVAYHGEVGRHSRMIHGREWDAAEVSLSSYLVAKDRGSDLTAIPVIPRRLFSQGLLFVRADSDGSQPADLEGQRVGIASYQTTLSVLAKGDLAADHGVDWKSITWVTNHPEALDVALPAEVKVESAPEGRGIADLLLEGDLAAVVMPHPPHSLIGSGSERAVRRLFPDPQQAERDYYRRHGYWPIMHLVALRPETVTAYPELPAALYAAFQEAKALIDEAYLDPNWSMLAWGRSYLDAERAAFGEDPWRNGVRANEANLRRFMSYSREQGLTSRELEMDELFHESVLDT